jgi:hypothetical protein
MSGSQFPASFIGQLLGPASQVAQGAFDGGEHLGMLRLSSADLVEHLSHLDDGGMGVASEQVMHVRWDMAQRPIQRIIGQLIRI